MPSPAGCSEESGLCDEVGPGFCPECVRKAGSGIAADQTNAMLAPSLLREGNFPLCGKLPPFLQLRQKSPPRSAGGELLCLAAKAAQIASWGLKRPVICGAWVAVFYV